MSVYRKRPVYMSHFPPDEVVTTLKSNAHFTISDAANDLTDLCMFQLGGAVEGTGKDLHASGGGTTGISPVQIDFELPRTWTEWIQHYGVYSVLSTSYEVEIQMAASDATGNVWICWWQTANEGRDIPLVGIELASGLFDSDNAQFTGPKQASQIIMNARGIKKVRTYRADALGGRRMIRCKLNHFMGNNGEWAGHYSDDATNAGNGANATVTVTSDETTNHGVGPLMHFAIIHQDFAHAPFAAEVFIRKFQKIHFLDRLTNTSLQQPT